MSLSFKHAGLVVQGFIVKINVFILGFTLLFFHKIVNMLKNLPTTLQTMHTEILKYMESFRESKSKKGSLRWLPWQHWLSRTTSGKDL